MSRRGTARVEDGRCPRVRDWRSWSRKVQCVGTGRMPTRQDGWMGWGQCLLASSAYSVVPGACNKGIVPHPAPKLLIQKLGDPRSLCSQTLSVMPLEVV